MLYVKWKQLLLNGIKVHGFKGKGKKSKIIHPPLPSINNNKVVTTVLTNRS